jgi:4Fe-4S ferredoxin
LEKESFPRLVREINIDVTKCPMDCKECEEACPFNLIKVTADKAEGKIKVEINEEHCPGCRLCEVKCPHGAMAVKKVIFGSIAVDVDKCPEGCRDCVDVCPVPGVLNVFENGKIDVDGFCCIYCGACKVVCPAEDALMLERTSVNHTPVRSGAWNKALEKLASAQGVAKELRSRSSVKAKDSVKRRIG